MSIAAHLPFEIQPTGAALGAEIRGVNLAEELEPTTIAAIQQAWDDHLVLLFRGQELDDKTLKAFATYFGELDPPGPNPYGRTFLPKDPELNVISNVRDETGVPIGTLGDGEAVWHADMTYIDSPPKGAVLFGLEIPEGQGDTSFANMVAAYAALPDDLKQRIADKQAIHDAAHNSAGMLRKGYDEVVDVTQTPGARHGLVRIDPSTGRSALFLGRRPHAYITGLSVSESDALLDELWAHAGKEQFSWRHKWQVGDVVMWQNHWVLHRRDAFDPTVRRVLHRAQIKGDS